MDIIRDSYATTPDGELMIADGMNPVKIWDGLAAAPIDAGLVGPDTSLVIAAASTNGDIFGTYNAYSRFLDANGNVSNLSPISSTIDAQSTVTGSVVDASETEPINIESTGHGLASGDVVQIEGVEGNLAANGRWVITVVDVDNFTLDGSIATGTYTTGGTWVAGTDEIEYTDVPVPTSSKVVRRQILRNTDGQETTYYVDVDTTDIVTTSFSSTNNDDELAAQTAVPILTELGSIFANANEPPPNYKCVLVPHSGRMFALVDRVYRVGSVSVTNASTTVRGIGTSWTAPLVGRFLYVNGASQSYEIEAVDVATQTITLTTAYDSATAPFATYAIRPAPAQRKLVPYSQAGKPQSWSATYAISIQEDGDEITGGMQKGSFLYILEYRHIYRLTFQADPAVDGFVYLSCQRGCINNECWVQVEDNTYMLDRDGIHAFGGGQESEQVSTPIQRVFQTLEESDHVINWNGSDQFHAAYYPQEEVVRWFVSMGSSVFPRHAICLHTRTSRWWLEEYPFPITASALGLVGTARTVFLGSEGMRTIVASSGTTDGIDKNSGTLFGRITSADLCSITDGSATFPAGVVGLQIAITDGKGKLQRRTIHDVDGTRIKVTQPWLVIPDDTSRYQIAGVGYRFRSRRFAWSDDDGVEGNRKIGIMFEPSRTTSNAFIQIFEDQRQTPKIWKTTTVGNPEGMDSEIDSPFLKMSMTSLNAYAQQRIESRRDENIQGPRRVVFEIEGTAGNDGTTFYSLIIDGVRSNA